MKEARRLRELLYFELQQSRVCQHNVDLIMKKLKEVSK